MAADTFQNDVIILGQLSAKSIVLPAGSVGDAQMTLANPVQATKLQHQYEVGYAQYAGLPASGTTVVNDQLVLHVVRGSTGIPLDFKAGVVVANVGAATVTVDLWRNGASILTSVITLNNSQAAYQLVTAAGFSFTSLVAGDVLEVKVIATAGGGTLAKGLFANLHMREDAQ
jgi:hypothetical protein